MGYEKPVKEGFDVARLTEDAHANRQYQRMALAHHGRGRGQHGGRGGGRGGDALYQGVKRRKLSEGRGRGRGGSGGGCRDDDGDLAEDHDEGEVLDEDFDEDDNFDEDDDLDEDWEKTGQPGDEDSQGKEGGGRHDDVHSRLG